MAEISLLRNRSIVERIGSGGLKNDFAVLHPVWCGRHAPVLFRDQVRVERPTGGHNTADRKDRDMYTLRGQVFERVCCINLLKPAALWPRSSWRPTVQRNPFKHHRFPPDVILCAVRWYCRFSLSCRDVRDLLAERRIVVDASTIHRWVRKFGPEIAKRSFKHRSWRGLNWHVCAAPPEWSRLKVGA